MTIKMFCTCEIILCMRKGKTKKQIAKDTLAEVFKEMAKPRIASSAKLDLFADLVVKNNVKK